MVASVWMFTTAGRTLCATTTTGVRRAALTVGGTAGAACCGATVCDSAAGLQARLAKKRKKAMRSFFMAGEF